MSRPLDSMVTIASLGEPKVAAQPLKKLTAKQQAWLDANQRAIEEYNRHIETHEDPLAEFRRL